MKSVHHQRLTTWKNTGTYRLILRQQDGTRHRLVYKRAVYTFDEIPANEGLPVRQGPPERVIAQISDGPLTGFLPKVHWIDEDSATASFDYLWEDLSVDHDHFVRFQEANQKTMLCDSLAAMHEALRRQFSDETVPDLLRYAGATFSEDMWDYMISALPRYGQATGDEVVGTLLDRRSEVEEVFLDPSYHVDRPVQVIHGDLNGTNVWVRSSGNSLGLKAVDWEWAGYGLPHADMISILKWSTAAEKHQFLEQYCSAAGLADIGAESRWLRRATMERSVLDAGFLARQFMDPARSQDWFTDFVRGSLEHLMAEVDVATSSMGDF